jgi:CheY-like chemotaxis protein
VSRADRMSTKPRILFVDDDAALLLTFSTGLEAEGYPVDAVSSTE